MSKLKQTKDVRDQGLDKFYTKREVSKMCISKVNDLYDLDKFDLIVEPSAGDGSFYDQIECKNKIGLDIQPESKEIIKKDFFTYSPDKQKYKNILTIGNPPFGKVSSLAIKFFNHSSQWSDVVAFIIPKTFRKISVQNRLDPFFHLVFDMDISTNPCAFEPPMNVKCCFQVWVKKDCARNKIYLDKTHPDWEFLPYGPKDENNQPTPPEGADFALKAYGGKCGEITTENLDKLRPKSWHWIKSNIDKEVLIDRLKKLDYSNSNNTARQNSIGRGELVSLYSLVYECS